MLNLFYDNVFCINNNCFDKFSSCFMSYFVGFSLSFFMLLLSVYYSVKQIYTKALLCIMFVITLLCFFIIFLEAVIDNSHSGAVINRVVIRDLRFTDDNALLSENVSVL